MNRARAGRGAGAWLGLGCGLLLAGCGGGSHPSTAVGVGIGVNLSVVSGTTLIYQGDTLKIDARVTGDSSNAGVNWLLVPTGVGQLTANTTPTEAEYQSPTGITGAATVVLVATSISDKSRSSAVTITVNGTPTIAQPVLFPANQNVPYAAYVNVAGGKAPYAWTVTGTLPAGLAPNASTTATLTISGTPTAVVKSAPVTVQVKDANGATVTVTISITVNAQTACLLIGRYAYLFTGFNSGLPMVRAGSFNVAVDGTATGSADYKDASRARIAESEAGGKCTTLAQNRGTLLLKAAGFADSFDFATVSSLGAGQLQQNDGSGVVGSATFEQQDATAFGAAALAGDYALFLVGDDGARHRLAITGRLSRAADGSVSGGEGDTSGTAASVAATLSGHFDAPDGNGRGTASLTLAGLTLPLAYYVVNAQLVYLVSADTATSTPRLAGRMTRQTGAGSFDASALAGPAILSLWGSSYSNNVPAATMTAGRLANATVGTGTLDVELDIADRGAAGVNLTYPGATYTLAPNGRGTLAFGNGAAARSFVLYLDGPASGYLLEPGSAVGNVGVLDQQLGVPFTSFAGAYYVGGTVFAGSTSPITLTPQLLLQNGSISGNLNGNYALDVNTGRIAANVSRNILGGTGLAIYIASTAKLVVIGNDANSVNSSLAWLQPY